MLLRDHAVQVVLLLLFPAWRPWSLQDKGERILCVVLGPLLTYPSLPPSLPPSNSKDNIEKAKKKAEAVVKAQTREVSVPGKEGGRERDGGREGGRKEFNICRKS